MKSSRKHVDEECITKAEHQQFRQEALKVYQALAKIRKDYSFAPGEELLFYNYSDGGDYVVWGYVSKTGNLRFVETVAGTFPSVPFDKDSGICIDGSIESLTEVYTKASLCQLPAHYSLSEDDHRALFAHEHLEKFIKNYKLVTKQSLMNRLMNLIKNF